MSEALEQLIRDWLTSEGESREAIEAAESVCYSFAEECEQRLDILNRQTNAGD